ncbi:hypothetical protein ACWFRJ_40035 [Streptomyces sp. NPDC055239]
MDELDRIQSALQLVTSSYGVRNDLCRDYSSSAAIKRRISQELPPDPVDRFVVVLRHPDPQQVAFFRMEAEVAYNADKTVRAERPLRSPLLTHPIFSSTEDELEHLRSELQKRRQPGRGLRLDGTRMEPVKAVRRWFESYEEKLKEVASIYVETGSDSCEEYERLLGALAELPRMRRDLAVDE